MGAKSRQPSQAPQGEQRRHECRVEGEAPGRADRYIAEVLGLLSRSQLKARGARIEVEGRPAKLSRLLKAGESLVVSWTEEPSPGLAAEDLPLEILYEDERVFVVNKAQGMVTHPGAGNRRGTLANALLGRLAAAAAGQSPAAAAGAGPPRGGAALRGGIVHRLDKDTSGLLIAAKDAEAQAFLAAQFKDRRAKKEYLAITKGIPEPREGRIENRLGRDRRDRKRFAAVEEGGRVAITDYRVLAAYIPGGASGGGASGGGRGAYALLSLRPRTGRTHQLRVHLALLGCPILGDPIYGRKDPRFPEASLMLHAYRLRILLPGREEASLFKAPIPARFSRLLERLEDSVAKPGAVKGDRGGPGEGFDRHK